MQQHAIFNEIYEKYAEPIYRHCFFRVYSQEIAEELMQDVFVKYWAYLERGVEVEYPQALLYRIANNSIIDYKRKKQAISLDAMLEDQPQLEPTGSDGKDMEHDFLLHQVLDEVKTLSERDQQLMIMRYVDDLGPSDIAEALGMTPNAVSVQLNRLVKKLRDRMHPQ